SAPQPSAPPSGDDAKDEEKTSPDGLLPESAKDSSKESESPEQEDEKQQVAELVGEPMSTEDALAYIDKLIAEFDQLTKAQEVRQSGGESEAKEDEKELEVPSGGMPPLPRPPVPNTPSDDGI